jgi:hypothetical protein
LHIRWHLLIDGARKTCFFFSFTFRWVWERLLCRRWKYQIPHLPSIIRPLLLLSCRRPFDSVFCRSRVDCRPESQPVHHRRHSATRFVSFIYIGYLHCTAKARVSLCAPPPSPSAVTLEIPHSVIDPLRRRGTARKDCDTETRNGLDWIGGERG